MLPEQDGGLVIGGVFGSREEGKELRFQCKISAMHPELKMCWTNHKKKLFQLFRGARLALPRFGIGF